VRLKDCISFDDVLLVPKYSEIMSRREISLNSKLDNKIKLNLPIISSPMDTVTEDKMVNSMSNHGGLGIIHRYNSIEKQVDIVSSCNESSNIGAAIGVTGDYLDRAIKLRNAGANIICVDIAHGHHAMMRHALQVLRNTFGNDLHIMAGNVATLEAFNDLADWGATSIRVGIGGGSICSTRIQTGHGMPTLQSVIECSMSDRSAALIADGGIKNSGDIVKCLAVGADFVMLGSILSGTSQSPGDVIFESDGSKSKVYRGMASKDAQMNWRGHTSSVEGVTSKVGFKGDIDNIMKDLKTNIRSGLSYTGATTITELQSKSTFIRQTTAGAIESSTHIFKV